MRHFTGWNPPPHPFEIVPPYISGLTDDNVFTFPGGVLVAKGSFPINAGLILLDYAHEDELIDWMNDSATMYYLGANAAKFTGSEQDPHKADPNLVLEFYLHPELYYPMTDEESNASGNVRNEPLGRAVAQTQGWGIWETQADVDQRWNDLNAALQIVVPRRMALPPLPPNTYDDPVTVYFYDTGVLKKQTYPIQTLTYDNGGSMDPSNGRWWAVGGAGIQDYDPNSGTWNDEGFNSNKDMSSDAIAVVVQILADAIAVVFTLTGVGAAAAPFITAAGAILADLINAMAQAFNEGDPTAALVNMAGAIVGLAGSAAKISPKLTTALVNGSGLALHQLAGDLDVYNHPEHPDVKSSLDAVEANIDSYPYADEEATLTMIKTILASTEASVPLNADDPSGLFSNGVPTHASEIIFMAGYDFAQWATNEQIAAVGQLMGNAKGGTGAAQALWQLGAHVGVMIRAQKSPNYTFKPNRYLSAAGSTRTNIPYIPPTPMNDLMSYVKNFLAPRYKIQV